MGEATRAVAELEKHNVKLTNALRGLLSMMNLDDEGDWFICKEAMPIVKEAEEACDY